MGTVGNDSTTRFDAGGAWIWSNAALCDIKIKRFTKKWLFLGITITKWHKAKDSKDNRQYPNQNTIYQLLMNNTLNNLYDFYWVRMATLKVLFQLLDSSNILKNQTSHLPQWKAENNWQKGPVLSHCAVKLSVSVVACGWWEWKHIYKWKKSGQLFQVPALFYNL